MEQKNKKTLKNIVSILITISFAFLLFYYIRKNWNDFTSIRLVSVRYLIILGVLGLVNLIFQGLSLYIIVRPFGIYLKWKEWLGITTWTLLGNYVFPFGGLGFRAAYLKKVYRFDYTHFISTLAALYIIQFLIYSISGLIGLVFIYKSNGVFDYKIMALLVIIALLCFIFIFISPKLPVYKNSIYQRLVGVINSFYKIKKNKKLMWQLTFLNFVSFLLSTLIFFFSYKALNFNINFSNILTVSALSAYTLLVKITPASFGIYEGIIVYSTRMLNLTIADGLTIAAITRLVSLVWIILLGPYFGYILFYKKKKQ